MGGREEILDKAMIPSFNPLCVVTDGATDIFGAFQSAVPGTTAKNIECLVASKRKALNEHFN